MTIPDTTTSGPLRAAADQDVGRWREATRLRREFPGWVVIWLTPASQYRAYRRLPGARRDTAPAAPTPGELAAQITQAEQATVRAARPARDQP